MEIVLILLTTLDVTVRLAMLDQHARPVSKFQTVSIIIFPSVFIVRECTPETHPTICLRPIFDAPGSSI